MNCEICGKPISNNPTKTKIDGSIMAVCSECAKFGRIQKTPKKSNNKKSNFKKPIRQNYRRNDEPKDELIENYNEIIRNKREAKNWTREKLGEKINEKVSVITRIESKKMIPDNKLTKKIEKTLNITLVEKIEDIDLNEFKGRSSNGFTIEDVVKIKRK